MRATAQDRPALTYGKIRRPLRPLRRLQELRLNEGLSPNELACRAGISGNTVRLAEAGHIPSPRVQFAITRVFGLNPLDLWPLESQRVAR